MNGNNSHHTGTYTEEEKVYFNTLLKDYSEHEDTLLLPEYMYFQPFPPKVYKRLERRFIVRHLHTMIVCKREGHDFNETVDGENGCGELCCERCGYSTRYQW